MTQERGVLININNQTDKASSRQFTQKGGRWVAESLSSLQRWEQRQISEELGASSLTHAQLITSHWVAGQEKRCRDGDEGGKEWSEK